MIRFRPIDFTPPWTNPDEATFHVFNWSEGTVEFRTHDGSSSVFVRFERPIVRIADEFAHSIEIAASSGLVHHHFAYEVEGHPFLTMQSAVWREIYGPVTHYCFVTGSVVVDVVAREKPVFEVERR